MNSIKSSTCGLLASWPRAGIRTSIGTSPEIRVSRLGDWGPKDIEASNIENLIADLVHQTGGIIKVEMKKKQEDVLSKMLAELLCESF